MSALDALVEEVEEAIAALPPSADDIAKVLADMDIKGESANACRCPIANYLGAEVKDPGAHIAVTGTDVGLYHDSEGRYGNSVFIELPAHVKQFVTRFDGGRYYDEVRLGAHDRKPPSSGSYSTVLEHRIDRDEDAA